MNHEAFQNQFALYFPEILQNFFNQKYPKFSIKNVLTDEYLCISEVDKTTQITYQSSVFTSPNKSNQDWNGLRANPIQTY